MIKTYKLTTPARNSSFILRGKSGNSQRYNFSGGDPMTGRSATIVLQTQYSQDLLEESDLFKQGYIKLLREYDGGESHKEEKIIKEDITSSEQLIEFVATQLEKVYKLPEAALNYAKNKGYEFPNLELKKEDK